MLMKNKIMVCVTRQKTCERLIAIGYKAALKTNAELHVVHVAKSGTNFLNNPHEGEALDYLFQISKKSGAEMSVLRSDHVVNTITEFVKDNKISVLILGESPDLQNENSIIRQLKNNLPEVEIRVIPSTANSGDTKKTSIKFHTLFSF